MADYNLGTASGRIVVDGSAAETGFNVARTAAGAFFDVVKYRVNEVQQLGRRMAAVGTVGVGGLTGAIKVAADFEQQMSGVRAVAGATEEQFDSLREKALELGKETSFSASEAASALEELVKAGIGVEDILAGAADAAVALAAAGGVSIPEAAEIAANAMNQFALDAEKVPEVADILAGVANTSAADVSGLGQSLSQAGAVANLAGLSFRDTAIALGEMANAGITGSDAGTSLKTMLNNLIPTTDRQSNEFRRLGLLTYDLADANKALAKITGQDAQKSIEGVKGALAEYVEAQGKGTIGTIKNAAAVDDLLMQYGGLKNAFFDAKGDVKDLEGLQGTLAKALESMTRQQKLASLELLFGADAMRASAILSLEGAKGYRQFSRSVNETSAADVAAVRLDNLKGSMEAFKGSIETAAITIGSVFLPVVTFLVKAATSLVNVFNNFPKPLQIAIAVLIAIASSGLLVIGMFLALLPLIASVVANFLLLRVVRYVTTSFKVFFATLRAGQGVMAATTLASTRLGTAMLTLGRRSILAGRLMLLFGRMAALAWALATGPIGIAIAIIGALVALGVLLYHKWEPFRELVDKIAAVLKDQFQAAMTALKPIIESVLAAFMRFGQFVKSTLLPVLQQIGTQILGALMDAFGEIAAAVQQHLLPALQDFGGTVQNDIVPALQGLWQAIQPVIPVVLAVGKAVLGTLLKALVAWYKILIQYVYPALLKVAGFLATNFIQVLARMVVGVIQAVGGIISIFKGLFNFFAGVFTGDWSRAMDGLEQIVSGLKDAVLGLFKFLFSALIEVVKGAWDSIVGFFKDGFSSADGATGGWVSGFISKVVSLFSTIVGAVVSFFSWTISFFRSAGQTILSVVQATWGLFGPLIMAVFGLIKAIVILGWTIIKGVFLLGVMAVWAVLKNGFNLMMNLVRLAMTTIGAVIRVGVAIWRNVIAPAISWIVGRVRAGFNMLMGIVRSVMSIVSGLIRGAVGIWNSTIGAALDRIVSRGKAAWDRFVKPVMELAGKVVGFLQDMATQALSFIEGLIGDMFSAGARLIGGLIDGITSKIGAVTDAIGSVTGAIGKYLPGSPVKEGPLTSWNRGGAGKRLMDFLGDGLEDTSRVEEAMRAATSLIAGYYSGLDKAASMPTLSSDSAPVTAAARAQAASRNREEALVGAGAARGGGGSGRSRMVEGRLLIDESGRAYIEGVAQDVYDENDDYNDRKKR